MKKLSILVLVLLGSFLLVSCKGDKTAPLFRDTANGRLATIEHLQGEEVDLLEGVRALDDTDGEDVTISIKDMGEYNKTIFGEYELIYSAIDKAGNESTVPRTVIVKEALDATINALVIGEEFIQIDYNNPEAFDIVPVTGAKFRILDMVQVMDKEFFLSKEGEAFPVFPYATIVLVNKDGKVKYARFAAGAAMEMDKDGTVTHVDLPWDMAGNGFGNIVADIDKHMEEDGYVVFAPPTLRLDNSQSTPGRIFLGKHLFFGGYLGGGMLKDTQNVDVTKVKAEIKIDYKVVIEKPAKITTPKLTISRHKLQWEPVTNAVGYELYIDGVKQEEMLVNPIFDLLTLELSDPAIEGHTFEVIAKTKDMFKYSDSDKSESVKYKRVELAAIDALVVTEKDGVLSWEAAEGAVEYEVFIDVAGTILVLGYTKETSIDIFTASKGYEGVNKYHVVAVGDNTHSDSPKSNVVQKRVAYVTETLTINKVTTTVVVYTAENYFLRRNGGLENYVYKVTGFNSYKGAMVEASSTVVLLDSTNKVKVIRNILTQQYTLKDGWHINKDEYNGGAEQMKNLQSYAAEGDYLLIGKNGQKVNFSENDVTTTVDARDFIAYHFVAKWDNYGIKTGGEGWRGDLSTFLDPSKIVFTLE